MTGSEKKIYVASDPEVKKYTSNAGQKAYISSCVRKFCPPTPSPFIEYKRLLYGSTDFFTIKPDGTDERTFGKFYSGTLFPAANILAFDRVNKRIWTWNHNLSPNLFIYRLTEQTFEYLGGYDNGFSSGYPPGLSWDHEEEVLYLAANYLGGFSANIVKLDEDFNDIDDPWINMNHIYDIWSNGLGQGGYGFLLKDGYWYTTRPETNPNPTVVRFQNIKTTTATISFENLPGFTSNPTEGYIYKLHFSEWDQRWYYTKQGVVASNEIWRCDLDFTNHISIIDVPSDADGGLIGAMTIDNFSKRLYVGVSGGSTGGIWWANLDQESWGEGELTHVPNTGGSVTNLIMWNLDEDE